MDYKESGVDIEKGDLFVEKIGGLIGNRKDQRLYKGVGGFAALYDISKDKYLATGTDGVGTKVKIAQELGIHNTIGIDLVAMCVNDIICTGATPLFFLDYLACGKLDLNVGEEIITGIIKGCDLGEMSLIGGETAEMPGVYGDGVYDLAGFAVGEVYKENVLDGSRIEAGDYIVGLPSSGLHSNGYSLARRLIEGRREKELALTPTRIYVDEAKKLMKIPVTKGFAHITGGGFHNVARLSCRLGFEIDNLPDLKELPEIFSIVSDRAKLPPEELYRTFNMGVGFMVITSDPDSIECEHWVLGRVTDQFSGLKLR